MTCTSMVVKILNLKKKGERKKENIFHKRRFIPYNQSK